MLRLDTISLCPVKSSNPGGRIIPSKSLSLPAFVSVSYTHLDVYKRQEVVERTLQEIGAGNKPVYVIFNKIDAYTYEEYDEFSLTPKGKDVYKRQS